MAEIQLDSGYQTPDPPMSAQACRGTFTTHAFERQLNEAAKSYEVSAKAVVKFKIWAGVSVTAACGYFLAGGIAPLDAIFGVVALCLPIQLGCLLESVVNGRAVADSIRRIEACALSAGITLRWSEKVNTAPLHVSATWQEPGLRKWEPVHSWATVRWS